MALTLSLCPLISLLRPFNNNNNIVYKKMSMIMSSKQIEKAEMINVRCKKVVNQIEWKTILAVYYYFLKSGAKRLVQFIFRPQELKRMMRKRWKRGGRKRKEKEQGKEQEVTRKMKIMNKKDEQTILFLFWTKKSEWWRCY